MSRNVSNDCLRIGIDGRPFMERPTGVGRYVTELCRHLEDTLPNAQFVVYVSRPVALPLHSGKWVVRVEPNPALRRLNRGLWLVLGAGRLCLRDSLHAFWGTVTLLPFLRPGIKAITTVYDLNHKVVPATMRTRDLWARRLLFGSSLARANAIVAISEGTAARLRSYYKHEVTAVLRPGVSARFAPQASSIVESCLARYNLRRPYLLAVGSREPRKNLELLIRTFSRMKANKLIGPDTLVLVGGRGWKDRVLRSLLAKGDLQDIRVLEYVADADLPTIYTGARALVFPSLYEGFGMPVLEARACGTPVVTTDSPELREAGGPNSIYVEPTEEGIRLGILKVLNGECRKETSQSRLSTWEHGASVLARTIVDRS
jgi:glycosyltransferase involved in cell wall biosynthesis